MGESGLGPIIEAHSQQQQQEGPSTTISEVHHHHPVTKSNKNGSSPGYLKVNIIFRLFLRFDKAIWPTIVNYRLSNGLIKFTAFFHFNCQLMMLDHNTFTTWPAGFLDQVSISPPFVTLNGRWVLIKQGAMALDKRKSPFHQEASQAWGVNDPAIVAHRSRWN